MTKTLFGKRPTSTACVAGPMQAVGRACEYAGMAFVPLLVQLDLLVRCNGEACVSDNVSAVGR